MGIRPSTRYFIVYQANNQECLNRILDLSRSACLERTVFAMNSKNETKTFKAKRKKREKSPLSQQGMVNTNVCCISFFFFFNEYLARWQILSSGNMISTSC